MLVIALLNCCLFFVCFQMGLCNAGYSFCWTVHCYLFCVCFQMGLCNAGYSFCWTVHCYLFCVFRSVYLMLVLVLAGLLFCVCFQTALHNAGHTFCWTVVCSVCFQTGMCNAGYSFCWTVINYSVFVFRWVCVMLVIVFAGLLLIVLCLFSDGSA